MADSNADRDWLPPLRGLIPGGVVVEAMARDDVDGRPDSWDPIDVARSPQDCLPGLTMCSEPECMEGWLNDYFLRVLDKGRVVWTSPDAPDTAHASTPTAAPSEGAVVIPFPRR